VGEHWGWDRSPYRFIRSATSSTYRLSREGERPTIGSTPAGDPRPRRAFSWALGRPATHLGASPIPGMRPGPEPS
jgi:hypothetical protein